MKKKDSIVADSALKPAPPCKSAALEGALAVAPPMSVIDQDFWDTQIKVNQDAYGRRILRYAKDWARLIEARLAAGDSLEGCAETAASLADDDGITGFMYGAAVAILSKVWKHGEELRRWHNLKTQIGDEGERANRTGGTLNPAMLNVTLED